MPTTRPAEELYQVSFTNPRMAEVVLLPESFEKLDAAQKLDVLARKKLPRLSIAAVVRVSNGRRWTFPAHAGSSPAQAR